MGILSTVTGFLSGGDTLKQVGGVYPEPTASIDTAEIAPPAVVVILTLAPDPSPSTPT